MPSPLEDIDGLGRGAHFRLDFPDRDDAKWSVVTRLSLGEGGDIAFTSDPVKVAPGATSSADRISK